MVHLKDCFLHRKAFNPVLEFVIKRRARKVEVFIVDAHRKHEMPPLAIGN